MTHGFLAGAIFALTIGAIVFLAERISEWKAALIGACLMLLGGIETVPSAWATLLAEWDVLLFFAGLAVIVAAAEESQLFAWLAQVAARVADGSGRRLYFAVLCVAGIVTVFFTNDAAVLVMIPLVAQLVRTFGLPVAPFALSVAFIANAASALLPISNPTNYIIAQAAGLTLFPYLRLVALPGLAAAAAALLFLWLFFGRRMRATYDPAATAAKAPTLVFRLTFGLVAVAMLTASALHFPVGAAAIGGGAVLILLIAIESGKQAASALRRTHVSIVVLVASLFVVVDGLRHAGLLDAPTRWLAEVLHAHDAIAAPLSALLMALASNVANNLPMSMVAVQMLHHDAFSGAGATRFAAGTIVGLAIGPNLTPVGSLSTILVLITLRRTGLQVALHEYLVPGALVTAITLLAAALAFF